MLLGLITLGCGILFGVDGYNIRVIGLANKPEGYEYPGFEETWITAVSGVAFILFEAAIKPFIYSSLGPLSKEQVNQVVKERRVNKMTDCVCKLIYFVFSTTWGYAILKNEPYLPPILGGSGQIEKCLDQKTLQFADHNPALKHYILVTSGYHVAHFFIHVFSPVRRNDFVEMALHHICAVYLYGGLYLLNVWEIGATIAFLHDIADIFANIVKFAGETSYDSVAAFCMVVHMSVWAWTRMVALPFCIYKIYETPADIGVYAKPIFIYLLSCMCALHFFWFYLFCRMIGRFCKDGKAEDIQSQTETADD